MSAATNCCSERNGGNLEIEFSSVALTRLLQESLQAVASLLAINAVTVACAEPSPQWHLATDLRLARRALVNALKNAVEAASPSKRIAITTTTGDEFCTIAIHNPQAIPEEVQHQIFQRSYSTKGPGRGLGTYGMRLLVEGYLGGKVSFSSSAADGTTFSITLPLRQ